MLGVGGMQRSRVLVRRTLLALREHFPQRPLRPGCNRLRLRGNDVLIRDGARHDYAAADAWLARCFAA